MDANQQLNELHKSIAIDFISRINAHDPDGIADLMSDDHVFIDIPGHVHRGKDTMRNGWIGYFKLFPDYNIAVTEIRNVDGKVVIIGVSSGNLSDYGAKFLSIDGKVPSTDQLQGPAVWTAVIEGQKISEWRVYWDSIEIRSAVGIT